MYPFKDSTKMVRFFHTNLHPARCHLGQCADQLADSQTQHKIDGSQHKLGETIDLQQQHKTQLITI